MRIYNDDNDVTFKNVMLFLKRREAEQLLVSLQNLLETNSHHEHINDSSYEHEITIAIYDERKLEMFDERTKKVLLEDA